MAIQSSVTISLVKEARGGPFVFWDDLAAGCQKAAELGFDAVEVFPPSAQTVAPAELRRLLDQYKLKLAAVGTGAPIGGAPDPATSGALIATITVVSVGP